MSLRKSLYLFMLLLVASLPFSATAQQPPTSGATVHGLVVDPDDALIPGATVTLTSNSGKSQSTTPTRS